MLREGAGRDWLFLDRYESLHPSPCLCLIGDKVSGKRGVVKRERWCAWKRFAGKLAVVMRGWSWVEQVGCVDG